MDMVFLPVPVISIFVNSKTPLGKEDLSDSK